MITLLNSNKDKIKELLCLFHGGSHLYGTNTPESDIDLRGVFIPTEDYVFGFSKNVEQITTNTDERDICLYELRKFLKLAVDNNPNILEILFVPSNMLIKSSATWNTIVENKAYFLSKKCKYTFAGYAHSQLQRIKHHKEWLLHPIEKKPTREDFGLSSEVSLIKQEDINAYTSIIAKFLKQIGDKHPLKEAIEPFIQTYSYEGILSNIKEFPIEEIKTLSGSKELPTSILDLLSKEKAYLSAKTNYEKYLNWQTNRNKKRAELEAQYGYDCYHSETKFLTNSGWKYYDEIAEANTLATINPITKGIEYQTFSKRIKQSYEGVLYKGKSQYTSFNVTPNHKLFVSPMRRSGKNNYSIKYAESLSKWSFIDAFKIKNKHKNIDNISRSCWHTLVSGENINKEYNISDDLLILIGLFASEGCFLKRKTKKGIKYKGISISQLAFPNKIEKLIKQIKEYKIDTYSYKRKNRYEVTYHIRNKELALFLLQNCGEYSHNKKLPDFIIALSKRQCEILITALLSGDGTEKPHSQIYYTTSKTLADGVNILAITAGFISKIWKYKIKKISHTNSSEYMFQVYIKKQKINTGILFSHYLFPYLYNGDVVCFEVPNSILITQFNGETAFQGNSKHCLHLFRLFSECKELLKDHTITLPRPDKDFLLEIKQGLLKYDEMLLLAEKEFEEIEKALLTSTLPHSPNVTKIEELCISIFKDNFKVG